MLKKLTFLLLLTLFAIFSALILSPNTVTLAQTVTATPVGTQTTGATSNVQVFFVACETSAVLNFNGTMLTGWDIYYQVFSAAGGGGTALTDLRRVSVNGTYAFSEVVNFNTGGKVAGGSTASARVLIAREGNPDSNQLDTTVNDLQDGCAAPTNPTGTSENTGGTVAGGGATSIDTTKVLSPFGGYVNEGYVPKAEEVVVIGARNLEPPRMSTPGLVFAECVDYPTTNPGLIYDTDNVTVFWSWFAKTPELVQQHIDNAVYEVGYWGTNPFPRVERSEIQQIGRVYWVFYTANLGKVAPNTYQVAYNVRWENPINDGYDDFGPGTANEVLRSRCQFTVRPNLAGEKVSYTFP